MKKILIIASLLALVSFGFVAAVNADTLQVTGGTGTDPVVIGTSAVTILFNPGTGSLPNLTVLFSVPTGDAAPSGLSSSVGTLGTIALLGNLAGSSSCSGPGEVYSCAGFSAQANSNNLTNFNAGNLANNGFTATSYDIYGVVVTGANLGPKGTITINGNLGVGTYIDGWGQNGNSTYFTAFTDAGLTSGPPTTAPEPASMLLLGLGLVGAPFLRRKK